MSVSTFRQNFIMQGDASGLERAGRGVERFRGALKNLSDTARSFHKSSISAAGASSITGNLDEQRSKWKSLGQEIKKNESLLKTIEKSFAIEKEVNTLTASIDRQKEGLSALSAEIQKSKDRQDQARRSRIELQAEIRKTNEQIRIERRERGSSSEAISKHQERIKKLQIELATLTRAEKNETEEQRRLKKEIQESNRAHKQSVTELTRKRYVLDKVNESLKAAGRDTKNLKSDQQRLETQTKSLRQEFDRYGKSVDSLNAKDRKRGSLGTALAGAGGVLAGGGMMRSILNPVGVAIDFEKQMSRVEAKAFGDIDDRATRKSLMARFRSQAETLGGSTSFSASQVGQGQELLAAAGLTPDQIIKAAPGLLSVAKAGDIGLGEAADLSTGILSSFDLPVDQIKEVGDILAFTSVKTKASMLEMGETFKYVGPIAKTMFGDTIDSVQRTAAAIGILHDANIRGSSAGTALRSAFTSLAAPSATARKYMKDFGVTISDEEGNIRNFSDILTSMAEGTAHLSKEERLEVVKEIVGTEALSAFITLLDKVDKEGGKSLKSLESQMKDTAGIAKRMGEILSDNSAGEIEKFYSALEGASIAFANTILPTITEFIKLGTSVLTTVSYLTTTFPTLTKVIGVTALGIGTLTAVGSGAILYLGAMKAATGALGITLGGLAAKLTITKTLMAGLAIAGKALFMTPWGLAIMATLGAGAMAYSYFNKKATADEEPLPEGLHQLDKAKNESEEVLSSVQSSNRLVVEGSKYEISINANSASPDDIGSSVRDIVAEIEEERFRRLRAQYGD